jgi:hypothetical protein
MAVSNAFGSNTFNIFIALAVPWLAPGLLARTLEPAIQAPGSFTDRKGPRKSLWQRDDLEPSGRAHEVRTEPRAGSWEA